MSDEKLPQEKNEKEIPAPNAAEETKSVSETEENKVLENAVESESERETEDLSEISNDSVLLTNL